MKDGVVYAFFVYWNKGNHTNYKNSFVPQATRRFSWHFDLFPAVAVTGIVYCSGITGVVSSVQSYFFFFPESLLFHSEVLPTVVTCLFGGWKLVGWQHYSLRAVIHNKYRKLCLTKRCILVSLGEKSSEWTLGLSKRHPTFSTSSLYKVYNHSYNETICPQSLLFVQQCISNILSSSLLIPHQFTSWSYFPFSPQDSWTWIH